MKRTITYLAGCILLSASLASAQVKIADNDNFKLFMTVDTVGTLQALTQENVFDSSGKKLGDLEPGFQTAWGNFGFIAEVGENEEIQMGFDIYIASRGHPSQTYGNEGWLLVRDMPGSMKHLGALDRLFDHIDLKVGHFLINFGDNSLHRSNNAAVQKNPLVGNFVIDPELVAIGAEIYGQPGRVNWMIGLSSGTTTENFTAGRGTGLHGKLWAYPIPQLRTSVSYFTVDHSDNPTRSAGGTTAQLFSGNRSGERYGGVLQGSGSAPGQVFPLDGQKLDAWQADVTWDSKPVVIWASYGNTTDSDTNGSAAGEPEEEWTYFTLEGKYWMTSKLYAAARWSGARADTLANVTSSGEVDRFQIGGGYWMTKNILAKLEYVNQKFDGFVTGNVVSGIQAWRDPKFSGFVAEVSFSF